MTTHISARMAWHMDGWNGHICSDPGRNCHCVGVQSYPGDKIKDRRDLNWEKSVAGQACSGLEQAPPCIYSINAFGQDTLTASDEPPPFFGSGEQTNWTLPPATVCVWPYEAMYDKEKAHTHGRVDNHKRLKLADDYFAAIDEGESLVFHYANYSNPFSTEDDKRYVVVGLARIKKVGDPIYYEGTDEETKQKFGGGYVWQRSVETHYPEQGMRIPYHQYLQSENVLRDTSNKEVLEKITFVPENPHGFKYGSRHISDDGALVLVERFIEIADYLRSIGDKSENWTKRLEWLNGLVAELWQNRGLYPGLANVLRMVGLSEVVAHYHKLSKKGQGDGFRDVVVTWLNGDTDSLPGVKIAADAAKVRKQWMRRTNEERRLLADILPRFDLPLEQMETLLSEKRAEHGLDVDLEEIAENPYLLSERYVGKNPKDVIPFACIDNGVFPSLELGGSFLLEQEDPLRLRALCVDRLKYETKHTFMTCEQLMQDVKKKLNALPSWKAASFTERDIELERETFEPAVFLRREGKKNYAYLRTVYDAEREIEKRVNELVRLPDITFKSPITEEHWTDFLYDVESKLARVESEKYGQAISAQAKICAQVFNKPVSVIYGSAGTGKTTIIKAVLGAINKVHGANAKYLLLAPTGKAADRIREKTSKDGASTIHSFLARRGWLNDNLTIKQDGGEREESATIYVIDESSMLDLELAAALFRAIKWNSVQRLIFVGDPNQLPPIGRGRVFADIIEWLRKKNSDCVGELTVNLRQMGNQAADKGSGILALAGLFTHREHRKKKDQGDATLAEQMFKRLQDLPVDGVVDKDLRVVRWKDSDDLMENLVRRMIADMEEDTGEKHDSDAAHKLWAAAAKGDGNIWRPEYHQVITPYRHESFGTEAINHRVQKEARGGGLDRIGHVNGITLFDKVLQFRNRGKSDSIWAYNFEARENQQVEIYNGELGFAVPHPFDGKKWTSPYFRLKRFQVQFARKSDLRVAYGQQLGYTEIKGKKRPLPNETPEDNLELAYAISVHKAQGSEFERVYFVVPQEKTNLLSRELFYTGITRATCHCTIFVQGEDIIAPLLRMRRPEHSHLEGINTSLFNFEPAPENFEMLRREGHLEEYRIHPTLADIMVRSAPEVIVANTLFDRDISFYYEKPLYAPDGSFYLPNFTVTHRGEEYYWEHLGIMEKDEHKRHWDEKKAWYERHFPEKLITTAEFGDLSNEASCIIDEQFV